jgi:hypothetical protein
MRTVVVRLMPACIDISLGQRPALLRKLQHKRPIVGEDGMIYVHATKQEIIQALGAREITWIQEEIY